MTTDTLSTVAQLDAAIARMASETAALRAENRRLRKIAAKAGRYVRIARRAHLDALSLYHAHASGVPTGREEARAALGVSFRRWYWARALAMLARVHNGRCWTDAEPAVVVDALSRAAAQVDQHGITPLIARLPKSNARHKLRGRAPKCVLYGCRMRLQNAVAASRADIAQNATVPE